MKYEVITWETVVRECLYAVEAGDEEEARDKYHNGSRRLLWDKDIDVLDSDIKEISLVEN